MSTPPSTAGLRDAGPPARSRSGRRSRYLQLVIALALLVLIVRLVDVEAALWTLSRVDARLLVLVLGLALVDRFLMAYKWNTLLRARGMGLSNGAAFRIYVASGFVGTFVPFAVGADVVRAGRTALEGRRIDTIAASILLERALGFVALLTVSVAALLVLHARHDPRLRPLLVVAASLLGLLATALLLSMRPWGLRLVSRALFRWQRYAVIRSYLGLHAAYVELSRHRRALITFLALSLIEQALQGVLLFTTARAIHLPGSLLQFLAITPLSVLVATIPISINAVGVQEAAYIALFGRAGLSPPESLALSLLVRVVGWILLVPAGLIALYDGRQLRGAQSHPPS